MTFDDWFEKYKPIANPTGESGLTVDDICYMYETYEPELAVVKEWAARSPERVWTLVDDGEGNEYIVDGFHYVNRIGYFITEVPAEGDIEVPFDD